MISPLSKNQSLGPIRPPSLMEDPASNRCAWMEGRLQDPPRVSARALQWGPRRTPCLASQGSTAWGGRTALPPLETASRHFLNHPLSVLSSSVPLASPTVTGLPGLVRAEPPCSLEWIVRGRAARISESPRSIKKRARLEGNSRLPFAAVVPIELEQVFSRMKPEASSDNR